MARRAPVTIEDIEFAMDEVALAIDMAGAKGEVYLPIYERLLREAERMQRELDTKSAVAARVRHINARKLEHSSLIGYTETGRSTKDGVRIGGRA